MLRLGCGALAAGALLLISVGQVSADAGAVPTPGVTAGTSPTSVSAGSSGQANNVSTQPSGASANSSGASGNTCGGQAAAAGNNYAAQPAQAGTPGAPAAPSCSAGTSGTGGQAGSGKYKGQQRGLTVSGSTSTNALGNGPSNTKAQASSQGTALAGNEIPVWPWMLLPIGLLLIILGLLLLLFLARRRRANQQAA